MTKIELQCRTYSHKIRHDQEEDKMKRFDCENIVRTEFGVQEHKFRKATAQPHWGGRKYIKTHRKPMKNTEIYTKTK